MKNTNNTLLRRTLRGSLLALAALGLSGLVAKATPFASCITNNGTTVYFYLNENGGNVTITYEDGSTNANYNPLYLNTGVNLSTNGNPYSFSLAGHSTYSISVYKIGTGMPSIINSIPRGACRGVAANNRGASRYFGYVYSVIGSAGAVMMHSDGSSGATTLGTSYAPPINGGTGDQWDTTYTAGECSISIAPDDSVLISDFVGNTTDYNPYSSPSSGWEGGIIIVDPTFTTAQLLLPNLYNLWCPASANSSFTQNHGTIESRAILTDALANNPNLYVVDGSGFLNFNQIVVYSNITAASLGSPSYGWPNQPDYISPSTVLAGYEGNGYQGYFRAGLSLGTNGYLYLSQDRNNLSNPNLQVWNTKSFDIGNTNALYAAMNPINAKGFPTYAYNWPNMSVVASNMLWCSYYFTPSSNAFSQPYGTNGLYINDYTVTGTPQLPELNTAPAELALSPDNRYIALVHDDSHVTLFTLTNGIPDISTEYLVTGLITDTSSSTSGRYVCWDAAGNLWVAKRHATATVYYISLGRTATCITTGNSSGPTGFTVVSPTEVDVTQKNLNLTYASQANSYGNPTTITNVITRSGNVSSPLLVNFSFSGTAPAGSYTVSPATGSILFAAGQTSTNIVITAVTDGIPRPTTTAVLTLTPSANGQYNIGNNNFATDFILNTATPQLVLGAAVPTMYKAFSNDFTAVTITRWGDTNTAFTTAGFTYGGTAVRTTDYATLSTGAIAFNKGDITKTVNIARPLINGQLPVYSTSITYTGDRTITVSPTAGSGYVSYASNNTATVTILDSAYPPATVIWSDPLTSAIDSNNNDGTGQWNITAVDSNDGNVPPDPNVDFGLDLTTGGSWGVDGMVPLPPSGATTVLRVTCAKIHGSTDTEAVNLYPTNVTFSGDYAVRFNMFINQESGFYGGEGPFFGINHGGTLTNWWDFSTTIAGGPWASDGVFYWVNDWAGTFTAGDYQEFTGSSTNAGWVRQGTDSYASYLNVFKTALYTSSNNSSNLVGGLPANNVLVIPTPVGQWADVEIKQVQNVVTMSINHTPIFSYANTNSYTTLSKSGCLMLGYETPGGSGGFTDAAAYFSNLQVVRLAQTVLTILPGTSTSGGNITIQFTSSNGADTTGLFVLQSAATVNGTYSDVSPAASFTQSAGVFQTVYPQNGPVRFYRVRHL